MKVAFLNLKSLYKENLPFAIMVFMTVFMGAFAICFSVGLLHNNKYKEKETHHSRRIFILFNEMASYEELPLYEENSEVVKDIMKIFGDAVYEGTINQDGENISFYSQFVLTDNGYIPGPSITKDALSYQVRNGRNFTEDDFTDANAVAITIKGSYCGGLDEVWFGENAYEVVGVRIYDINTPEFAPNYVVIPITAWGNNPISSIYIELTRIPFESEVDELTKLLDKHFAGKYTIANHLSEVNADTKALYKTIRLVVAGIITVVIVTMFFLMGYIYEKRSYSMALYRLLGLKNNRVISYFLTESAILLFIPAVLGTVFFEILRRVILSRYYVYMVEIISIKFYAFVAAALTAILMVVLFAMSCSRMFMSVKKSII